MNILIVSSYLPYPLYSGGNVRLYNLIKELSKKHSITLVCEKRPNQTQEDVTEVEKICEKVITVDRKKQWSLQNIFTSGISSQPFLVLGHTLSGMKKAISIELRKKSYDLIHVETFYIYQNLPPTELPVLVVEHNIEYQVYERFMKKVPSFLRPLLMVDVKKIKKAEEKVWKNASKVVTVSEEDKKVIGREDTEVVANGVNLKEFNVKRSSIKKEHKILYIGDYKWIQNTDAAAFIITHVWPHLKNKAQALDLDLRLWLVGRNMPMSLKLLGKGDDTIIFDDTNTMKTPEIFSEASILLAPKRVGGGTSYKIIESLAVGTPVVTTPLGLEGLEITEGKDVLVAKTSEELAEHTISLLKDGKLYSTIAKNGREQVEKKYDWPSIAKKLDTVYSSLIK